MKYDTVEPWLGQLASDIHDDLVTQWQTEGALAVEQRLSGMASRTLLVLLMAHIGADAT